MKTGRIPLLWRPARAGRGGVRASTYAAVLHGDFEAGFKGLVALGLGQDGLQRRAAVVLRRSLASDNAGVQQTRGKGGNK